MPGSGIHEGVTSVKTRTSDKTGKLASSTRRCLAVPNSEAVPVGPSDSVVDSHSELVQIGRLDPRGNREWTGRGRRWCAGLDAIACSIKRSRHPFDTGNSCRSGEGTKIAVPRVGALSTAHILQIIAVKGLHIPVQGFAGCDVDGRTVDRSLGGPPDHIILCPGPSTVRA